MPAVVKKTTSKKATSVKATVSQPKVATGKLAAALEQHSAGRSEVFARVGEVDHKSWLRSSFMNKALVLAWVLVIAGALFYFKGQFVVATVNGQPILRTTLVKQLELQTGKQALDNLIIETLVRQEAVAKKVVVTDEEINAEIQKIQERLTAQKQDLDQLLAAQGMTKETLKDQIKLQLSVEKMVDKASATPTAEEVQKYLADNKAFLPADTKPADLEAQVKAQLEQQKLATLTQDWLKTLQDKAKINHWLFVTK